MATQGETELWGRRRKGAGLQHITQAKDNISISHFTAFNTKRE
jgi:hypothetical protein